VSPSRDEDQWDYSDHSQVEARMDLPLRLDMPNGRLRYRSLLDDTGYTLSLFWIGIDMYVLAAMIE